MAATIAQRFAGVRGARWGVGPLDQHHGAACQWLLDAEPGALSGLMHCPSAGRKLHQLNGCCAHDALAFEALHVGMHGELAWCLPGPAQKPGELTAASNGHACGMCGPKVSCCHDPVVYRRAQPLPSRHYCSQLPQRASGRCAGIIRAIIKRHTYIMAVSCRAFSSSTAPGALSSARSRRALSCRAAQQRVYSNKVGVHALVWAGGWSKDDILRTASGSRHGCAAPASVYPLATLQKHALACLRSVRAFGSQLQLQLKVHSATPQAPSHFWRAHLILH